MTQFPTTTIKADLQSALANMLLRTVPSGPKPTPPQSPIWPAPAKRAKARRSRTGGLRYYTVPSMPAGDRRSGWRLHMITTARAHDNTLSAAKAHIQSGQYTDQSLDWAWLERKGYIQWN